MAKRKKRILIVEDEPFLVEMYTARFEQAGYEVRVAYNGTTVAELVKSEHPDIILLDIVMPETDGYEVLRQLKKNKSLSLTPILVFSNLGQDAEIEKGKKLGADKYLVKSDYTPSQLVKEVEAILSTQHSKKRTKRKR